MLIEMQNEAKSQVNSLSIALILTTLGAQVAVLNGLNYPDLRLPTPLRRRSVRKDEVEVKKVIF
ncbi:hypothetical protein ACQKQC_12875 [Vibrio fortis]|uniref:hypothetical protein n=1 Tax=Vibrio fortis TaxID=212667 RepID=UPI0040682B9E